LASQKYLDVSTCFRFQGKSPVGIVRTEYMVAKYILDNELGDFQFCKFDTDQNRFLNVSRQELERVLSSIGTQETINASTSESCGTSLLSIKKKIKSRLKSTAKQIYHRMPPEVAPHFKQIALDGIDFIHGLKDYRQRKKQYFSSRKITSDKYDADWHFFQKDDIYINLGLMWDFLPVKKLYNEKKKIEFKVVSVIYDLIPFIVPEYCNGMHHQFLSSIVDLIWLSNDIYCISDHTLNDVSQFIKEMGMPSRKLNRIYLGTDIVKSENNEEIQLPDQFKDLKSGNFILFVSTIEARKNHELVYQVWRQLYRTKKEHLLPVIFVGMMGWTVGDLFTKIQLDTRLFPEYIKWGHGVSDTTLEWLYKNCRFTVFPSHYEGWGLPVAESLSHGKICISSNAASLPEVGTEYAEYINPIDIKEWVNVVGEYMTNDDLLKKREEKIRCEYVPFLWKDGCEKFIESIKDIE